MLCMGLAMLGCKDLTQDPGLPAGTPDPSFYNTADGAKGLRVGAIADLNAALPQFAVDAGLLSDELIDRHVGTTVAQSGLVIPDPLDERILPDGVQATGYDGTLSYTGLQNVRGAANVALGALAAYDTATGDLPAQRVLRGELYALQGYAEIMLAELFCSGVPLSTLDFQHDFTYQPGSTAAQVYMDVRTKLDSALVLAAESDSVFNMARVLKGRAQLDLGNYAAAADDVSLVPTTFQYRLAVPATVMSDFLNGRGVSQAGTVADNEGTNGLPFLSSGDPRTAVTATCHPPDYRCPVDSLTMPAKYFSVITAAGYAPFVVANGVEARLIQAEAALHANDATTWLTTLNQLRENAMMLGQPQALPDTSNPGSDAARVSLLFHERAYWLFMTGHRQGDLRRLIRQYGIQNQYPQFRSDLQVYPTGVYPAPGAGRYGNDITVPIPTMEYNNPSYHGCLDRNA